MLWPGISFIKLVYYFLISQITSTSCQLRPRVNMSKISPTSDIIHFMSQDINIIYFTTLAMMWPAPTLCKIFAGTVHTLFILLPHNVCVGSGIHIIQAHLFLLNAYKWGPSSPRHRLHQQHDEAGSAVIHCHSTQNTAKAPGICWFALRCAHKQSSQLKHNKMPLP